MPAPLPVHGLVHLSVLLHANAHGTAQEKLSNIEAGSRGAPAVGLRSYQRAAAARQAQSGEPDVIAEASDPSAAATVPPTPAFNPFDLVEEVDLLSKLAKSDFSAKVGESKWSEKKGALDLVVGFIGEVPKLKPDDYQELMRKLKPLVQHSHQQVSATAIRVIGLIAEVSRRGQGASGITASKGEGTNEV